ncbi:hypothetical protein GCM10027047_39010 [Rhodococcus aerolatus]
MFGSRRDDTTPTTGPSRGFAAAAGLIGLVAIGLVVVLVYAFTRPDNATPTTAAPATQTTSAGAPSSAVPTSTDAGGGEQGRPAGCATTGTDQTVPTSSPAGITWGLASGVAVPSSSADGPALHADAGVAYCYSHTPVGALLAASNIGQGTGSKQAQQDATLSCCVVPNQYAAAVKPAGSDSTSPTSIQLAGFRFITYTPDQASITLAYNVGGATGQYSGLTFALQWYSGDWRVVPQPGPSIVVTAASLPSLASFTPWSGVS